MIVIETEIEMCCPLGMLPVWKKGPRQPKDKIYSDFNADNRVSGREKQAGL